tara:strand:- start:1572 stop:2261 length:690 start_codon:yes stop_codon:yes gene_type:complete
MVGTFYNAVAVGLGATLGLALGSRIPESLKNSAFTTLGLFTLGIGILMCGDMNAPFGVFLALMGGGLLGHAMDWDAWVQKRTERLGAGTGSALTQSVLLFCAGAMTIIGCMNDGLHGDPTILLIKGTMDFVSAAFLAAAWGRGVLLAAPVVLLIQGCLTWMFQGFGNQWSEELIQDYTGLGGILLLALGMDLLGVRSFKLLNLIPAFFLLPFMKSAGAWLQAFWPQILA